MTSNPTVEQFESWLETQPEEITPTFGANTHPLAQWMKPNRITAGEGEHRGEWVFEAPNIPVPDWMQYVCNRTFRKPYGVAIRKGEVQHWLDHWKADQA